MIDRILYRFDGAGYSEGGYAPMAGHKKIEELLKIKSIEIVTDCAVQKFVFESDKIKFKQLSLRGNGKITSVHM